MSSKKRHGRRAGMSILEVTTSLALLGVVTGPLWEATRLATSATRHSRERVDAQARGRALREALSEAVHTGRTVPAFSVTEDGAVVEALVVGAVSWRLGPSLVVRTRTGYAIFEHAGDELVRLQVDHDGRVGRTVVADGVRAARFAVLDPVAGARGLGGVEYQVTLDAPGAFEVRGVVATRTAPELHGAPPEAPRRAPRLGAGGGR